MRVLLVGGGGREAALAWAIRRSPRLTLLRCAPGNAGIARHAELVPCSDTDLDGLVRHARDEAYDLVVIGPETPLVLGLADRLEAVGIPVFGPSAAAARIEGSKAFAKALMARCGVPTAAHRSFGDLEAARGHLESSATRYPLVVKADGLAAGKGVVLADRPAEAIAAAREMLEDRRFGEAGSTIVVEECLRGREASFFVLSDGKRWVELDTCQDYKRADDGDRGPNTGGMGTYSPSPYLDAPTRRQVIDSIVAPVIRGLAAEGCPFRGVLYVGLMLTAEGPRVIEFNARFGDPETQVLMPRLDGDWLELLAATAAGELPTRTPRFHDDPAVCVVMTSGGYPGTYARGHRIHGLESVDDLPGVVVFHAGTAATPDGAFVTHGGRVLGVTAVGPSFDAARERAYAAVSRIGWDGERHRSDIALGIGS